METNNPYYTRKANGGYNPCIAGNKKYLEVLWEGCVLPNCVGYATGRFNEIGNYGKCKYLGNRNANKFIELAKKQGLEISDVPSVGACMVWDSSGCGHVAIVEEVVSDDEVKTSESGWSYKKVYYKELTRKKGTNWGQSKSYTFLGFIKNPGVTEKIEVPQEEPEEEIEEEPEEQQIESEETEVSKEQAKDLAERTIATGAETILGLLGSSTLIAQVDWPIIISATAMAMLVCVLKWVVKNFDKE